MRTIVLNTSILTDYGSYRYEPATLKEILSLLQAGEDTGIELISAVGHAATAEILSEILFTKIPVNRITYEHKIGDVAVVFKLRGRPPEGSILSREEVEKIGYDFGVLYKDK